MATSMGAGRLGPLLEQAGFGICQLDPVTGVYVHVNDRFCEIVGYPREEVLGHTSRAFSHPDDAARGEAAYAAAVAAHRGRSTLENRYVTRDGRIVHARLTVSSVEDEAGERTLLGVVEDVTEARRKDAALRDAVASSIAVEKEATERKRQETELERAEEQHRLALEAAGLGTFRRDIGRDVFELDARARYHMGQTERVVTLQALLARVPPEELGSVRAAMGAAHDPAGPGRAAIEHRVIQPSGDERWVFVHVRVQFRGEGAARVPIFEIATTQDVTEARRAAESLRASEDRYRTLVENLAEVLFSIDTAGRVTFVSRAVERYGYDARALVGQSMETLVDPADVETLRAALATRLSGETTAPIELRMLDSAGRPFTFRSAWRTLVDGGRVVGFTGLATDVTKEVDAEKQLRASQRMEAIGRLAGGVAHDFNNLLTVILSYVELALAELRAEDPMRADLTEVREAAKRAAGLTMQLLAFSRRQVLEPSIVDLAALVDDLSNMLRRLIGEDIDLEVTKAANLFKSRVDPGQIDQVLLNLVVNARDAMPEGGTVRVALSNARVEGDDAATLEVPAGDYVELRVADDGTGMPPAVCARIFEPFYTTKGVGKGTGLGLSTVHGIVKQSGGGISVDTSPGEGTTFHVYLPRYQGADQAEPQPRRESTRPRRNGWRVLVVEDEAALRAVVERALRAEGYDVLVADGPQEAIRLYGQPGPRIDLVLTDVIMPGMSGPELVRHLAATDPSTKMLFMSGHIDEVLEAKGVPPGRFLRKPFDPRTLASKVRSVIESG